MVSFIVYAYRENSGQTVWMHRPTTGDITHFIQVSRLFYFQNHMIVK